MKPTDAVYQWMTPAPFSIHRDAALSEAQPLFEAHGIQHLPVLDQGTLVGLLSERDLQVAERFGKKDAIKVNVVMSSEPFVTHPSTPLQVVAAEMASKREDAAVVVEGGRVVGVFTASDAIRAVAGSRKVL